MGQTLGVAAEKKGYTLTDRGTYLSLKNKLGLEILSEGDPALLNLYHVIEVNPSKWPKVDAIGAKVLVQYPALVLFAPGDDVYAVDDPVIQQYLGV